MSKHLFIGLLTIAFFSTTFTSCKKNDVISGYQDPEDYVDTSGTLKSAANFKVGAGIRLDLFKNDPFYAAIVKQEFNSITFENEMKHGVVVANNGTYDYSKVDEFVDLTSAAGLSIYGHPLIWHKNNNNTYLRSLTSTTSTINLLSNSGFENGFGNTFTNWSTQVSSGAVGSFSAETVAPYLGTRSMKVDVTTPGPFQYNVQAINDPFTAVPGQTYTLTFYAKAALNGSRFKAVIQNTTYMEQTIFLTPTWQKYSWTFTANETSLNVKFHFPFAGTFYFDDLNISAPQNGNYVIDPVKIDTAMKSFITNMVFRYKNKITAWDIVNEPFEDASGNLRTNPIPGSTGDFFYWSEYLGRDYIAKAFRYANAADPNALLFINEDKLESNGAKVDSMVKLINELKAQGVPIHGIGIQMHVTLKNDRTGITNALTKLAATGLKIKISEMDVRVNPYNLTGFNMTSELEIAQRNLYRFIVDSYYRLVPASQRYGISVWDITDKDSWIVVSQQKEDFPTLFNKDYKKKWAYYAMLVGIKKGM
ncbi:hypothetical protein BH09BAC2_BH09BAC2_12340 [soil metagenome]